VKRAEATEQIKHSTRPSKPATKKSDIETVYYQYDEKLITTIMDFHGAVNWVKWPDRVGEIPLSLVASPPESCLQENPKLNRIFLDFGYQERIF
jgi:hypothetical protein